MRIREFLQSVREAFTCPKDVVIFIVSAALIIAFVIAASSTNGMRLF